MAAYFLGSKTGTSKDSGNTWCKVSLLLFNRFGDWVSKDYFVDAKLYKRIVKRSFAVGDAVLPIFDGSGEKPSLKSIVPDPDHQKIVLIPDDDDDED